MYSLLKVVIFRCHVSFQGCMLYSFHLSRCISYLKKLGDFPASHVRFRWSTQEYVGAIHGCFFHIIPWTCIQFIHSGVDWTSPKTEFKSFFIIMLSLKPHYPKSPSTRVK